MKNFDSSKIMKMLPEAVIIQLATLSEHNRNEIQKCRGQHNRLGFAYQLMFVKIFNRFPNQIPLEIQQQILTFACLQLNAMSEHQQKIRSYLNLKSFDEITIMKLNEFLFVESQRVEQAGILSAKTEQFLKEQRILQPASDTLMRLFILPTDSMPPITFYRTFNSYPLLEK